MERLTKLILDCERISGFKYDGYIKTSSRLTRALGRTSAIVTINTRTGERKIKPQGIKINKDFLENCTEQELRDVVAHEFAHYMAYKYYGDHTHNSLGFKRFCNLLKTTHENSIKVFYEPKKRYKLTCNKCGKILAFFPDARKKVIRNNGVGFYSLCCNSNLTVTKL